MTAAEIRERIAATREWHVLEKDEFVRDNSDGWCCSCTSEMDACRIRDRHNAEVAALRATIRDLENEHSDKLAAVMEYLRENAAAQCQCEHNRDGERVYHCDYCQDYENACRIAEDES